MLASLQQNHPAHSTYSTFTDNVLLPQRNTDRIILWYTIPLMDRQIGSI